ncbi:MAG: hypothetical protein J7K21_00045 [Desulfurococcales archaeon]|nr:hypothetical protein [Desulfurococcales archaeon]
MPKTPSVILRNMLAKHQIELLDIYRFKDHDLVRIKLPIANKVYLVKVGKHITDLASDEDYEQVVKTILNALKPEEEKSKESKKK